MRWNRNLSLSVSLFAVLTLLGFGHVQAQAQAPAQGTPQAAPQQPAKAPTPAQEQKQPEKEKAAQEKPPEQQPTGERGAQEEGRPRDPMSAPTFAGLRLRLVGPAMISGRIVAFAVDPTDRSKYYVAAASGGVWKTVNAGTTWTPVFDNEGSYSIGTVVLDPENPSVVWVGTGENNAQRSVAYGDGVYRSEDGGRTWKNIGLKNSEHIGRIVIDPRNSDVVYVAAQGPLWGPGGDRGLFKTTDGGKTWKNVLNISENTGATDVVMDPQNSDLLYAATWQRRRHVFTLIDGGPESAIYKSTDAGATWTKLRSGLPTEEMGRIGLAVSPADPRVVYATIEAANRASGIFRSADRGATWERRNPFEAQGMYYGQITADPKDVDRIYIMSVVIQVSDDGGRTVRALGERSKHVDSHVIWIDPANTDYYLVGCDGGVYESFDRAATWSYKSNLPLGQFYDVTADNARPFYNVYGGTQDNFSVGGPSGTRSASGITNADWFVTNGGDGFQSRVDLEDSNTVYATSQYGGLVRFDRRTGERMGIQPQEGKGEESLRWNWDSPLLISPHAHTRVYFAANKLFRSDDRGDTWRAISGELSRGIDRNSLPVMGKVWGADAVGKNQSTSFYGNATAVAESPRKEGLLYVGTDDGLLHVTENGGGSWQKIDKFPGVPERTFVSRILASQHAVGTLFMAFDNHKNADFAPYLLKSTDNGKTWNSIKGDLPANGPVLAIAEDHVNPDLLFVGTEFGLFFTVNGGQKWIRLRGGFPTVAVRDLAIQKRENDLVVGTFGRGIYILDNYSLLQTLKPEALAKDTALFPVRDALLYIQPVPYGGRGKSSQGEAFYTADNPPFGATFTFYLKEPLETKKQKRQRSEREAERKGSPLPYPAATQLREEEEEEAPGTVLTVTDASGNVVRRLNGPVRAGLQRVTWDLRFPATTPPQPPGAGGGGGFGAFGAPPPAAEPDAPQQAPSGTLVLPGEYKVTLAKRVNGEWTQLAGPFSFNVAAEGVQEMPAADRAALVAFQRKVGKLQGAVTGTLQLANELRTRLGLIKRALQETPGADNKLREQANSIEKRLNEILMALRGDTALRARNENTPISISERVQNIVGEQRLSTARPTQSQVQTYGIAAQEFAQELAKLRALVEGDLARLEKAMEAAGAPWTPGRIPEWKENP